MHEGDTVFQYFETSYEERERAEVALTSRHVLSGGEGHDEVERNPDYVHSVALGRSEGV